VTMQFSFATIAVLLALLFVPPLITYIYLTIEQRKTRRANELLVAEMQARIEARHQATLDAWDRELEELKQKPYRPIDAARGKSCS
jgi:hypothetical protein